LNKRKAPTGMGENGGCSLLGGKRGGGGGNWVAIRAIRGGEMVRVRDNRSRFFNIHLEKDKTF